MVVAKYSHDARNISIGFLCASCRLVSNGPVPALMEKEVCLTHDEERRWSTVCLCGAQFIAGKEACVCAVHRVVW